MESHPGLILVIVGIASFGIGIYNLLTDKKNYSQYAIIMTWTSIVGGVLSIIAGIFIAPRF